MIADNGPGIFNKQRFVRCELALVQAVQSQVRHGPAVIRRADQAVVLQGNGVLKQIRGPMPGEFLHFRAYGIAHALQRFESHGIVQQRPFLVRHSVALGQMRLRRLSNVLRRVCGVHQGDYGTAHFKSLLHHSAFRLPVSIWSCAGIQWSWPAGDAGKTNLPRFPPQSARLRSA